VTGWNKAHPAFSRGLSTAERAVFTGALWRAEKRIGQLFRRQTVRPRSAAARGHPPVDQFGHGEQKIRSP
jgi:hypothetical protein